MAGGPDDPGTAGGGADIPSSEHPSGRLTRAAGSVGLAAALAGWVLLHPGDAVAASAASALTGVGMLVVVVAVALGRARLVAPAIGLLGAAYLVSRVGQPVDATGVWSGAILLVVAELAFWSIDLRLAAGSPPGGHRRRWRFVAGVTVASLALAAAVVVTGALPPGGAGRELMAAVAAVAVLGLVVGVAGDRHPPVAGEVPGERRGSGAPPPG
ncbi:MAG: hypothetical protein LC792_04060 [Actinobacteria bacterium]|nr:hypothetical protein [Actinomycetota bacterium]